MKWKYQIKQRIFKNIIYIFSCSFCFIFGNFIATLFIEPQKCIYKNSVSGKQDGFKYTNEEISLSETAPKSPCSLVILILSSIENYERRVVMRETWLSQRLRATTHFFVIGVKDIDIVKNISLHVEQTKYNDLILLTNIVDSYDLLTIKLKETLVYIHNNMQFEYLLKIDDDSYVNLDKFYQTLEKMNKESVYWGFFDGRAIPFKHGKWKENEWLLCDRYIPYALGGGYVLSSDLVKFIALNSEKLKVYKGEDVSVGAWLAPLAIHRVHDTSFDTEFKSRGCSNKYIITHKQNVSQMKEKYKNLQKKGVLCSVEFKTRLSYEYNWEVAPSQCCSRNNSSIP